MRQTASLAIVGLVISSATLVLARAKPMTENQKYAQQAREDLKRFEAQLEPEDLNSASRALEHVNLAQEPDSNKRHQLRADCLSLWLNLLQLLDRFLDPNFDPKDVPERLVQPPPSPDGSVLRPGADPSKISDPKMRAEYEKAIADNREKARRYRMQIALHRVNDRVPPRAEGFIRSSYTGAPQDQQELRSAMDSMIKDPLRKAGLLKLLVGPRL